MITVDALKLDLLDGDFVLAQGFFFFFFYKQKNTLGYDKSVSVFSQKDRLRLQQYGDN